VCFTAKRFEKLAGGKRSATTGTLQKVVWRVLGHSLGAAGLLTILIDKQ